MKRVRHIIAVAVIQERRSLAISTGRSGPVGTARCAVTVPFRHGSELAAGVRACPDHSARWTRAGTAQRAVPTALFAAATDRRYKT